MDYFYHIYIKGFAIYNSCRIVFKYSKYNLKILKLIYFNLALNINQIDT